METLIYRALTMCQEYQKYFRSNSFSLSPHNSPKRWLKVNYKVIDLTDFHKENCWYLVLLLWECWFFKEQKEVISFWDYFLENLWLKEIPYNPLKQCLYPWQLSPLWRQRPSFRFPHAQLQRVLSLNHSHREEPKAWHQKFLVALGS